MEWSRAADLWNPSHWKNAFHVEIVLSKQRVQLLSNCCKIAWLFDNNVLFREIKPMHFRCLDIVKQQRIRLE